MHIDLSKQINASNEREMEFPFFDADPCCFPSGHRQRHHDQPKRPPAASGKHNVVRIPVLSPDDEATGKIKKQRHVLQKKPATAQSSENAAVRIQRFWRGFLVRNSVTAISLIAAEASEMERTIRAREAAIGSDPKERLRTDEMLMALLLRLDDVHRARDYRKKVIRRVISLQEFVDAIAAQTSEDPEIVHAVANATPPATVEEGSCSWEALDPREAMEKMTAANERLERMVVALCESSAEHCHLITSLVERVEQLDQALKRMETEERYVDSDTESSL